MTTSFFTKSLFLGMLLTAFNCLCTPIVNADSHRLVIINSYHPELQWTIDCTNSFLDNLNQEYELFFFHMDTKRIPKEEYSDKINQAWELISKVKPSLIVTMDDNALKYLGQEISDSEIPLVFMGVNQNPRSYFRYQRLPKNVTGVLERPLIKRSMTELCKLIPGGVFLMMTDNSITSKAIIKNSLGGKTIILYGGCRLEVFAATNFSDWKQRILTLTEDKYQAVITNNHSALKDKSGNPLPINKVSKWTKENCPIPLYSFWRYNLQTENQGGFLQRVGSMQGKNAAEIVNEILKTGKIPPVRTPAYKAKIYKIN